MKIAVAGAGITGLTLAWELRRALGPSAQITLLEAADRIGGHIRTLEQDGFLFEQGPHSCRTRGSGAAVSQLVRELRLESEICYASVAARRRYLWRCGALERMPWFTHLPLLMAAGARDLWATRGSADETVACFVKRRFGRAVLERLVDPLISGIYAGKADELSVEACFPLWKESELRHRSLLWAAFHNRDRKGSSNRQPIFSFRKGMSTLVRALAEQSEAELALNRPISREDLSCYDALFLTIPLDQVMQLLPELRCPLGATPHASIAVVNCGWRREVAPHCRGFGYLVPSSEGESLLGCIWDSTVFPEQQPTNSTVFTAMLGGSRRPEAATWDQETLLAEVRRGLARHLGIETPIDSYAIYRAEAAIPQYRVGHRERLARARALLKEKAPHVVMLGCGCDGVSLGDCVASARQIVRRFAINEPPF